jgi:hypothetical protein
LLLGDAARSPEDIEEAQHRVHGLQQTMGDAAAYHAVLGVLDLRQKNLEKAETEFKGSLNLESLALLSLTK